MVDYKKRAKALVSHMMLDEKLAQMGSYWIYELQTAGRLDWEEIHLKLKDGIGQITRLGGASTFPPVVAAQVANKFQKFLRDETRLGIPAILHEECCLGPLTLGGSVFPQMIGLASSFRPELAGRMAEETRLQLMAIGARQGLSPVLDIGVDPRWGRIEETFGEDPTLVSHFGTAYIKGLQSDDLSTGVIATGKHFIGHSLSRGGLNCAPVQIGLRDIYETLLPPFQAAIRDAKIASIMNSYPEIDGDVVAASPRFLTHILREELGFDGLLVSDYEAIIMLHSFHFVADSARKAAVLALKAGIEVEVPTTVCYSDPLRAALEAGEVSLEMIDKAVQRHLEKKYELGLFDNPFVDEGRIPEIFDNAGQRRLAHEIALQSMVLLKNNGVLPLKKSIRSLAVVGPNADTKRNLLGDYSYAAMASLQILRSDENAFFAEENRPDNRRHEVKVISVLDGIQSLLPEECSLIYAQGCEVNGSDDSGFSEAVSAADSADAVILVLGDLSGLTPECTTGETRDCANLRLPGQQERLAEAVLATGKPVVIVLINGRPYAIPDLVEKADAVLEAWLPGEEGGSAVAEILFGEANPGGKLPVTFPRSAGQLPMVYNAKPSGKASNWYVDYVDESVTPLFPFGHGLSYTTFEYSDCKIHKKQAFEGESVGISVKLRNTGTVAGDEVVQLYIHQRYASIPRPVKELKGYQRVHLRPEESCMIKFDLPVNQLAFYRQDLSLVLERGVVDVMIGSSSEDIQQRGSFEIIGDENMVVTDRIFVCPVSIER
jgi:beta-glucosidase